MLSAEVLQHSLGFVVHITHCEIREWKVKHRVQNVIISSSSSQRKSEFNRLWHLSQQLCFFVMSGILGFFPYFLVTIERLGTGDGNKYSLQAAQARYEHWALNQCSEQQLPAFVIQSKRNKRVFASI